MKTKTLIGIAVASTFGWAASTYAGSSHEVITPLSVSEAGEVLPSTAWDYYVIDTTSPSTDQVAATPVDIYLVPAYEVVVF
jgi:hypothetical protein